MTSLFSNVRNVRVEQLGLSDSGTEVAESPATYAVYAPKRHREAFSGAPQCAKPRFRQRKRILSTIAAADVS